MQTAGATQSDGTFELNGSAFTVSGGELRGTGIFLSNVPLNNTGGTVTPGSSAGTLTLTADYAAGASSGYRTEIGGTAPTAFDRCLISGPATLDGTIQVDIINAFVPAYADHFVVMTFPSRTGTFTNRVFGPLGGGLALRTRHNATDVTVLVVRPGDLNCDGNVTVADIPAFVLLLPNPSAYTLAFLGCETFNGDFNLDELINGIDIQGFVKRLLLGP